MYTEDELKQVVMAIDPSINSFSDDVLNRIARYARGGVVEVGAMMYVLYAKGMDEKGAMDMYYRLRAHYEPYILNRDGCPLGRIDELLVNLANDHYPKFESGIYRDRTVSTKILQWLRDYLLAHPVIV